MADETGGLVPLAFMGQGETGTLVAIRGLRHHDHGGEGAYVRAGKKYRRGHLFHTDRGHRLEHRLNHMGMVPGRQVRVVKNNAPGPIIVAVKDARICLARGVASHLYIRPDGMPGLEG